MNVDFRERWYKWPVQCLLLLCILLLPAGTAWALPQSNELDIPSEALVQSVLQSVCLQTGRVLATVSGADVSSDLARATRPFTLMDIDQNFFEPNAPPYFLPNTPIVAGAKLCALTFPAPALPGLSDYPTLKLHLIISLNTGAFGIAIAPPIAILPAPLAPSYEEQHQVFQYLCPPTWGRAWSRYSRR